MGGGEGYGFERVCFDGGILPRILLSSDIISLQLFFITAGEGWGKLPLYYWRVFCHQPYEGRYFLLTPPRTFPEKALHFETRLLLSSVFNLTFQF